MPELHATGRADTQVGVVELVGTLDRDADGPMTTAYADAVALDPQAVLLDFAGVDYINSTGIAVVVGVLGRARSEGREVRASGLTDHYRHIFEITRLADFITFVPSPTATPNGQAEPA